MGWLGFLFLASEGSCRFDNPVFREAKIDHLSEWVCCINFLEAAVSRPLEVSEFTMQRYSFKHHRFPPKVILCTVRWYWRFALSCQDVCDLLAERGIEVDVTTIHR